MKPFFLTLATGLILSAPLAQAQVTINQAALDQLAGIVPMPAPAPIPKPAPVVHRIYHHHPTAKPTAEPPVISPAILTTAKPATPAPPPAAEPVQQAVAKPALPKPVPLPSPAVIGFATGAADLPAGTTAALKPFCAHPAAGQLVTIDAYAAADPADPSSAPRLSMNRAFAIRDALTACGIPAQNIIPRADGAVPGKNPDTAVISAEGSTQ